ncbi:hypothetical protein SFC07_03255 [Corynebacterium callunae]|uniref:hypothetical protein n=1 Tax=Corynebacterium callunae TaxID=1721 RepID=UPI0039823E94
MAELKINKNNVTVHLSWWEKIGARRSHLTIPRRAIRHVEVVDNVIDAVDIPQKRAGRTRIPGIFVAGTRAYTAEKVDETCCENEFSVCRKNEPGLVIELENVSIDRIVISTPNAQRYARELATVS